MNTKLPCTPGWYRAKFYDRWIVMELFDNGGPYLAYRTSSVTGPLAVDIHGQTHFLCPVTEWGGRVDPRPKSER